MREGINVNIYNMEMRYELVFDDITDEFGKSLEFFVLRYTFELAQEVNHLADERVVNHPDAHQCILRIVLQYPNNYGMQEWMVSYLSDAATRKSGTFTSYNEDGSILSQVRFENAECMQLDQKGELEEGRRQLTKTMTVRFATQTLAIDGITVFGELQEDRRAGVTPTVREVAEEKKVTDFYITDEQGNKRPKYKEGDTIYANIISIGKIGDTVDIKIPDKTKDFKYQGNVLPNDTISNYTIQSNTDRIALEVISQQNITSQDGTE